MQVRIVSVLAAMIALAWSVQCAQAGAIRYAAKELHNRSVAAVQKTSDATRTAAGSLEDTSKVAGAAFKNGTAALEKGTASAPGMAVRQTKAAASKVWNAVW